MEYTFSVQFGEETLEVTISNKVFWAVSSAIIFITILKCIF